MKKKIAVLMVSLLLGTSTLTLNIQPANAEPADYVWVQVLFADDHPVKGAWVKIMYQGEEKATCTGTNETGHCDWSGLGLSEGWHVAEAYYPDSQIYFADSTFWVDSNGDGNTTIRGPYEITPPEIQILSPENETYTSTSIPLTFTVYDYSPISCMGYSLDNQPNVTLIGNTTLSGLSYGYHYLAVYANDTYGNMGASGKILFAVSHFVPDDYPTIQEAINNANEGDIIFVRNGTYYENVVVNKTVSLIGENRTTTILDGNGNETGIHVIADNVTIEEFTVQNFEAGIKVESNNNVVHFNQVSSNGNNASETETNLEIYQDYVSPLSRWYLHNLIDGSYTGFFNITELTPVIGVHAFGHEDVHSLAIGLFYDENRDNIPQLLEFVGVMDGKEQNVKSYLIDPPEGQYIIKVMGWDVPSDPGHFDLKIVRYTGYGIGFFSSENNTVTQNLAASNPVGVYLRDCYNTTVRLNNATVNICGIAAGNSTECVISENNATLNHYGAGISPWPWPYISGIGISLWSVRHSFISENYVAMNALGICLWNSSENELIGNRMFSNLGWGLGLHASCENTVLYNNISLSTWLDGVRMMFASRNNITENYISFNYHAGIFLWLENDNNTITRNKLYSNIQHGVELKFSDSNVIAENKIGYDAQNGILIIESTGCRVRNNLIFSNLRGIMVYDSFGNTIYHNSVIDNWEQPSWDGTDGNFWDNGYPDGGNYWSDYEDVDQYSGPHQNETGSDGIWDHPCGVGVNNQDNYPLTKPIPSSSHDIGITGLTSSKTVVGQGFNLHINVAVFNYGNDTEPFNVTAYYDDTAITLPNGKNYTTTTLSSGDSTTLTFTWNTTGVVKGNYTITVRATPVPSETDLADNFNTDGWVIVTILGDVNGDFEVDVFDKVLVGAAFGATYNPTDGIYWHQPPDFPEPCIYCPHSPNADINGDGIIDVFDKVIVGYHFGETEP